MSFVSIFRQAERESRPSFNEIVECLADSNDSLLAYWDRISSVKNKTTETVRNIRKKSGIIEDEKKDEKTGINLPHRQLLGIHWTIFGTPCSSQTVWDEFVEGWTTKFISSKCTKNSSSQTEQSFFSVSIISRLVFFLFFSFLYIFQKLPYCSFLHKHEHMHTWTYRVWIDGGLSCVDTQVLVTLWFAVAFLLWCSCLRWGHAFESLCFFFFLFHSDACIPFVLVPFGHTRKTRYVAHPPKSPTDWVPNPPHSPHPLPSRKELFSYTSTPLFVGSPCVNSSLDGIFPACHGIHSSSWHSQKSMFVFLSSFTQLSHHTRCTGICWNNKSQVNTNKNKN